MSDWIDWLTPGFSPLGRLALIFGLFAVLMTLRAVTLWQRDFVLGKLQMMFVEEQRVKVARRLANAEWRTLAGIGHERITHLLGGDIQRCGAGVYFLLQSGTATVMLVGQAVLAFVLSPLLAFVAIGALTLGTLAMSGLLQRSRDIGRMVTEASLALTNGMGRFLTGIKVAMSQNLQHVFVAKFEHDIGEGMRRQALFVSQQAMLRGLWSLLGVGIAGTTMLVGFGLLHLSAPVLLALLIVLSRVSGPASQLHLGFQQIAYSLPAWQAVTEMERELAAAAAPPAEEQENAPRLRGSIVFDDVAYRHHGRIGGGIQGVTLRIDEGEMVGLSGASGAGKTTLADLLVSLIEPQFGRIIVGGELLTPGIAPRWRRQIAYVAQDAVMFNDSLRQNLIWSTPGASDADIARALAVAGADTWTEALPQGLGTIVGEGGALISGGERQRLALARALLRAPSLLVLDEATSAIDIESEAGILARLRALEPLVTILMIAHRSESLRFCDRVFVLAEGALLKDQPTRARGAARLGTRT
ncbi:MAG TPA: ABC transporter ATP-binding protein [Allosphingosinicella sp.]|nr:ABC transporter ATP-binding protein [Allosphingosinicella sp.]